MYLTSSIRAMTDTNSAITLKLDGLRELTVTHRPYTRPRSLARPAEEKTGTAVRRAFHYSGRDSLTSHAVVFFEFRSSPSYVLRTGSKTSSQRAHQTSGRITKSLGFTVPLHAISFKRSSG